MLPSRQLLNGYQAVRGSDEIVQLRHEELIEALNRIADHDPNYKTGKNMTTTTIITCDIDGCDNTNAVRAHVPVVVEASRLVAAPILARRDFDICDNCMGRILTTNQIPMAKANHSKYWFK